MVSTAPALKPVDVNFLVPRISSPVLLPTEASLFPLWWRQGSSGVMLVLMTLTWVVVRAGNRERLPGKGGWKVERLMSRLFKEFELQDSGAGWFWWWTCCWWAVELLGCIDAFCCCSVKDVELEVSWVCRWANLLMILLLSIPVGRFSWFSEEKITLIRLRRMCEIYSGNKYLMTPRVPAAIFSLCLSLKNLNFFFQKIPYFFTLLYYNCPQLDQESFSAALISALFVVIILRVISHRGSKSTSLKQK